MLLNRPRRNRKSAAIRSLLQETHLHSTDLVYPLFVKEGNGKEPIASLPFTYRFGIEDLLKEIERAIRLGIQAIALFPVIHSSLKNEKGGEAFRQDNILYQAIRKIKKEFPTLCLITDVALDPYTSHGHDGVLNNQGEVDNDATVQLLVELSLLLAEAGADIVAPSDMMDGRIKAIREALEIKGYNHVNILSYAVKYASAFYAPFREALGSSLKTGDKKSYQMNPANAREALREAVLDENEGADLLMIKPALPYLDIIYKVRQVTPLPIAAYQVSGEFAALFAADSLGWLNGSEVLMESLIAIKRAGADLIFTYGALLAAERIRNRLLA